MEEYLTVQELGERIKFSKQSLYNLIYKKKFTLGVHYLKPTPKKILFVWSEIEKWLQQSTHEPDQCVEAEQPVQNETEQSLNGLNYTTKPTKSKENPPASAIRI
jgi:predicted DNA-binding transcriptional regulator AlpA